MTTDPVIRNIGIVLIVLGMIILLYAYIDKNNQQNELSLGFLHKDITVTFFWVGEEGSAENNYIPNDASAWDDDWKDHFGGIDDPNNRSGYYPKGFIPKENPFYFALPFNDIGNVKMCKTVCKNSWIKIIKGDKIAYAQWEDVGPFEENDIEYVFGKNQPKNKINDNAGLDVSPAVRDYLGLKDIDNVDWQFVDFKDVPNGPWKVIITQSIFE